jgi:hypothetical protein
MSNNSPNGGPTPIWLLGLAIVLGLFLTAALPKVVGAMGADASAWIGFWGSSAGAAITLVAGAVQQLRRIRAGAEPADRQKDVVWFALNDDRPLTGFAGMWTKYRGDRGTQAGLSSGHGELAGGRQQ